MTSRDSKLTEWVLGSESPTLLDLSSFLYFSRLTFVLIMHFCLSHGVRDFYLEFVHFSDLESLPALCVSQEVVDKVIILEFVFWTFLLVTGGYYCLVTPFPAFLFATKRQRCLLTSPYPVFLIVILGEHCFITLTLKHYLDLRIPAYCSTVKFYFLDKFTLRCIIFLRHPKASNIDVGLDSFFLIKMIKHEYRM